MSALRNFGMFAGIGGMELGLHRAGIETIAVAETDPYASRVLAAHFPNIPNLGDVTKADPPAGANFITAGFPCQDISNAGMRAGITGSRSGLYGHVVRAIRLVRPIGALLENVAALLNRGMGTVLGDLAEVGYDTEWHCIPASAVGAPHIRDRVWIYAEPQHPNTYRPGSYRAQEHHGRPEPRNEQGGLVGSLGALLANAARERRNWSGASAKQTGRDKPANSCEIMANTDRSRLPKRELQRGGSVGTGRPSERQEPALGGRWPAEPDVGRVAHGIPKRVDRLRCLGNAVVPQIPEIIGHAILSAIADTHAQRGDGTKIAAPFMSSGGAVRQSPNPSPSGA